MNMKLRPYKPEDSQIICSWVKDEKTLFQWSADRIGKFPLMGNELNENYAERKAGLDFFPLTAIEYAKKELKATKATLGVFANNPKAQACYEAVGFKPFSKRVINILGADWECIDMELELN